MSLSDTSTWAIGRIVCEAVLVGCVIGFFRRLLADIIQGRR